MGAICVSASSNNLSKYHFNHFFFLWQNAGLKHGKVLVPFIVSYIHNIRFQVDHVWTVKGSSIANIKGKRGLKERQPGPEDYHHGSYICLCFKQ